MGLASVVAVLPFQNSPRDPFPTAVTILGLVTVSLLLYSWITYDKRRKFLPPGPRGLPLIGNLLDFADADKLPEITRSYAKYGDVSYTKVGGTDFVWLNTPTAVKDIMDKRGSKYSSRPALPMAFDAGSGQKRQIFMPYGDQWRGLRKITHAALNLPTSNSYTPVQDFESKQVMYDFLHAKDEWAFYDINRRYSASVILTVIYGHRIADWSDPVITKVYQVLDHFTLMSEPGAWLVDAFPSLAKLPSFLVQNWWKKGREWFEEDSATYLGLYRDLVEKVKQGTAPECFVKDFYLADPEKNGIDELGAAYAAGSMVEAGSESTSTVINAWLMACLLYPETMKAAQEEIDRVVGNDRMPTFEDEPDLPYIRALAKEALRWWPITKVGANHAASEDDWYNGMFIPKGAVVMLNWWAIHFDPQRWKDSDSFDPSRYLNDPYSSAEALNIADPNQRDHYTYGAGRRVCAGIHVAQNSLFINMARTMWAFDVVKATGPDGNPVDIAPKSEPGSGRRGLAQQQGMLSTLCQHCKAKYWDNGGLGFSRKPIVALLITGKEPGHSSRPQTQRSTAPASPTDSYTGAPYAVSSCRRVGRRSMLALSELAQIMRAVVVNFNGYSCRAQNHCDPFIPQNPSPLPPHGPVTPD